MKFADVTISWPGKVNDANVFSITSLCEQGQSGTLGRTGWQETIKDVNVTHPMSC